MVGGQGGVNLGVMGAGNHRRWEKRGWEAGYPRGQEYGKWCVVHGLGSGKFDPPPLVPPWWGGGLVVSSSVF